MSWFSGRRSKCFHPTMIVLLVLLLLGGGSERCEAVKTFRLDIHHRFSDHVKAILGLHLPEKGSLEYFKALLHRDRLIKNRRLAVLNDQTPVTFADGNETSQSESLGYLHYAYVSVGTPALRFLVALDTGSDLFWLPCDCISCAQGLMASTGQYIDLNIYSRNRSSSGSKVPCNSNLCEQQSQCSSADSDCLYQAEYLSNGTSSTGVLVEDVLHLKTDDEKSKLVDSRITFGCGQVQTGSFLDRAAPNGLFGLGMDKVSVPSMLAKQGVTSNSFSMCFGPDGSGRISFGDKGSPDQGETPFNLMQPHSAYNISISQLSVGGKVANIDISAIFDSGTSFTFMNGPAYKFITETFNSLVLDKSFPGGPFEYCYEIRSNETSKKYPLINLTMKGGDSFPLFQPMLEIPMEQGGSAYCLAVLKGGDLNIIGQNFMTDYHIVYDREKMVLGWKKSKCYDIKSSKGSTAVSPSAVNPEATAVRTTAGNSSPRLISSTFTLILIAFIQICYCFK